MTHQPSKLRVADSSSAAPTKSLLESDGVIGEESANGGTEHQFCHYSVLLNYLLARRFGEQGSGRRFEPNSATLCNGVVGIALQDRVALVDEADYDLVSHVRWHFCEVKGGRGYVKASLGNNQKIALHRVILGRIDPNFQGNPDHINGNTLDNRRSNLRPATSSQNGGNTRLQRNSTSGFKGVSWDIQNRRWIVILRHQGRRYFCGRFIDPEAAARAYDAKALELFGEYARLNFPQEVWV